ncbi:winged helix-turn-helix domain-containing protein [Leptolyngbya sp. 7M]|uniref:winged helix-turn-helix domain-containing protein n=1 Tax=Leptolyngbya sp. 7M TaxID=2812896 RepID=UPI001B8B8F3F|nr:winged helix-turn-helix domain-containing protein [Leptolyngbya sp. 7M]QYO66298.1 winged helix-turn-helix domain-containing protein [Leptolyngbya sp. 7M]
MDKLENKGFVYECERFVLDPFERTLLIEGQSVHLPAKEFETLLFLVEHNGQALSKEEILAAIWPDTFVEEGNLTKQISRLRKVLNTSEQQFIETIPKHGYRFTADLHRKQLVQKTPEILMPVTEPVQLLDQETAQDIVRHPVIGRKLSMRYLLASLLLIAVFGFAAAIAWITMHPTRSDRVSRPRSIAVLPFKSVAADFHDDNLRLGLTDGLITKLSGIKQIVVRPTNAVLKYETSDLLVAGRELAVDAVLDGNVQRIGQKIRVTVQLVSVRDGSLLWGGAFDEEFTDVFRVQDAIVEQAVSALALQLTGEDRRQITKDYTANPEAHYAYVRGRVFWNKRTIEDFREAIKHFNQAIEKDPNYALAYSGLADSYSLLADYRGAPTDEAYSKAEAAALKALELDNDLAQAHTSLAYVRMYHSWNWKEAESRFRKAIALSPNYATAHQWYSEFLTAMGRFDEALVEIRRAKEIDPLAPIINAGEVWVLYYARRYDEAIENGKRLAETNPQFAEVYEYLKRCYDQKGMYREAIAARQMRRKLADLDPIETPPIKRAAAASSPYDYWRNRLDQEYADARNEPPANFDMAEIYAQMGEKDKAFEWLEKALKEKNYLMVYLKVAPNLDPIRSDERFVRLLQLTRLAF